MISAINNRKGHLGDLGPCLALRKCCNVNDEWKELEKEERMGTLDREQFLEDVRASEVSGRIPQRRLGMWKEARSHRT